MKYQIVLWKYDGPFVDSRYEWFAETYWNAIESFDLVTRGVRGHYQAWLVDTADNKIVRESSVLTNTVG